MKPEASFPCSQKPSTGLYPKPHQPSPYNPIPSLTKYLQQIKYQNKQKQSELQLIPGVHWIIFDDSVHIACVRWAPDTTLTISVGETGLPVGTTGLWCNIYSEMLHRWETNEPK
jgi:hypothetical protein